MGAVGRRRFLMVLAGATGLTGLWWSVRPDRAGPVDIIDAGRPTSPDRASAGSVETHDPTPAAPTPGDDVSIDSPAASISGRRIEVIPRIAWKAAAAAGTFTGHEIERITIHHSAVALRENRNAPARLRLHQRHHLDLGWPDIAYHFMIDRDGNIYEGRSVDAAGDTGTDYDPTGHFLPMCEGDFDQHDPTEAQLDALAALVGWARRRFSTDLIDLHRTFAATACPGDRLAARLDDVVARSAAFVDHEIVVLASGAGTARVGAIEA